MSRLLTPGIVSTLNSGVENCSFLVLLPFFRFKIGVVVADPMDVVVVWPAAAVPPPLRLCIDFNSIKSSDATEEWCTPTVAVDLILRPDVELIAIIYY